MKDKGVLDEDASIYRHKEEENERTKWKRLTGRQKIEYFNDYYRAKVILVLLAVILVLSVVFTAIKNKSETTLAVAVINDYWNDDKTMDLINQAKEEIGLTMGNIVIDDSYYFEEGFEDLSAATIQKFNTHIIGGSIAIIVADPKKFDEIAGRDMLLKPAELFEGDEEVASLITEDGYGISLKGNEWLKRLGSYQEEMILGVVAVSEKQDYYDYVTKFIKYMLRKP